MGMNMAISFLDDVHEGRKGLPMYFRGKGAHLNRMVGCIVMELSEFSHGGLHSNFEKFLEPGFETVGFGKCGTNDVGVGIVKSLAKRIWENRGWVIVPVACIDCAMHGAVLVGPIGIGFGVETDFCDSGWEWYLC
jgi:hypothetical protein